LEPLFALKQEEGEGALSGAAKEIGARLYEHLGVMHRSDLEDLIAGLDPDLRKALRSKGVRLGPVLAFLPALVKPAAIKMRAMLWALWNDKPLPVARPADGRVSEAVDPAAVDRHFYRMIGYPVFGKRAIRIDMLDRVVTDVYDSAKEGVFEAQHKYAEWLGCGLEDLHAVLEAMGHRRLKAEAEPVVAEEPKAEEAKLEEVKPESAEVSAVAELVAGAAPKAPVAPVKFMLKRGKMSERPRPAHKKPKDAKPRPAPKKVEPQFLTEEDKERIRARDERKKKQKGRGRDKDERDRGEGRVFTFEAKKSGEDDDGNPFAILKNLKK
jgi:ATP-dependent RNA helicase SUPV3L1/SUV3